MQLVQWHFQTSAKFVSFFLRTVRPLSWLLYQKFRWILWNSVESFLSISVGISQKSAKWGDQSNCAASLQKICGEVANFGSHLLNVERLHEGEKQFIKKSVSQPFWEPQVDATVERRSGRTATAWSGGASSSQSPARPRRTCGGPGCTYDAANF